MPTLDFSNQADPIAAPKGAALDFSGNAEPVTPVSASDMGVRGLVEGGGALLRTLDTLGNAMNPGQLVDQALMRQQLEQGAAQLHPATAPADWFTRSTAAEFGPQADPAAAQRMFEQADADASQQARDQQAIKESLDPLGTLADRASAYGALAPNEVTDTAGKFAHGVASGVPQLAAAVATGGESALPELLPAGVKSIPLLGRAISAILRGAPTAANLTAEQATNLPGDLTPAQQVVATAKAAAENLVLAGLPGAVGTNPLTRTATGAALGYGTSAAQQAMDGHLNDQDQVQNTVGAFLGALLGGAHPHEAAMDPHLKRYSESAPDFSAEGEPVAPQALPRGADFTARAEPVRPSAPDVGGPVHVDSTGTAATPQQAASAFTDLLAKAMQPRAPGLPEPVVNVDRKGVARTSADINSELAAQQAAADEKLALGLTPDIVRTQSMRWSQDKQFADAEAERQARVKELDDAIAAREAQNKPARGINAKPDESVDDALTFLAKKGGLDRREFVKEGIDPAVARHPQNLTRGGASRPLFRAQGAGGMSLDRAADILHQYGYLPEADNSAALDMILSGVNQDSPAYSIHRAPQDDLLALHQSRQDAADHVTPSYRDIPFSFAGERAQTADRGALDQAKQLEAMGRDSVPDRFGNQPGSPEDTHLATGWHRGVDGKWRFEIDDSAAQVTPALLDHGARVQRLAEDNRSLLERRSALEAQPNTAGRQRDLALANHLIMANNRELIASGGHMTVGQALDHPALMKAYPALADVALQVNPHMRGFGAYSPSKNAIEIRPPSEYHATGDGSLKSVLLHEIQHAIQNHEGFARGGSSAEARKLPEFEQALRQQMAERGGELPAWDEVKPTEPEQIKAAREVYRRLAGEVEARNTQRRMNMGAAERRAVPPSETADVPRHQQIVRFNGGTAHAEDLSHADRQAIQTYNATLSAEFGEEIALTPAAHVPEPAADALAAFDAAFGGKSIVVDNGSPEVIDFNGVTLRDGFRLINADAASPLLTVAGHEMVHQLKEDAPDLYAELEAEVRRQGRLDAYEAVLNARSKASGDERPVHPDLVAEELAADAAGDALSDPEFIEKLAQKNPGLFRQLASKLMAFLARVSKRLQSLGSNPFLADVEAFRAKLADVLDRYAQRQQGPTRAEVGEGTEPVFNRAEGDDQTRIPAFRRWFGDSKVVDAEGKPLVVYHGTGNLAGMESFKPELTGQGNDQIGSGFYFTTDPSEASSYAHAVTGNAGPGARKLGGDESPGVASVYLSIKNPIRVEGANLRESGVHLSAKQVEAIIRHAPNIMDPDESPIGNWHDIWGSGGVKPWMLADVSKHYAGENLLSLEGDFFRDDSTAFRHALADVTGHDGVMHDFGNGKQHWVAWFPEQIKSATGNAGTFDAKNPSILFSRKPAPNEAEFLQDMPSRRPGESQNAYLRRVTRKNGEEIKAATALAKTQRTIGRQMVRAKMATEARQLAIADAALREARKTFDKTPDVINYASVHEWETGQPVTDPDFRAFVATMQDGFDQRVAEIHRLAPDALKSLIEHYMPHLYEDSGKATKWYQSVMGKRPLAGDKSFLKQRTWPTLKEAMASGLKPISPNPVDWVLMKYAQMDKFIGMLRLKENLLGMRAVIKLEPGQRPPEGWGTVEDASFQIAGGLQGRYAVPELIARDLNTHLAPGLEQYGAWRSLRAMQNTMVSWNLGFSAFHAGFTSIDNAVTHGGVGLQRIAIGDVAGGLKLIAKAIPTMLTSPLEGGRLNREWAHAAPSRLDRLASKVPAVERAIFGAPMGDPHVAALLDVLEQGGARMQMSNANADYNNALPRVLRAIRRVQAPGALADALDAKARQARTEGLPKAALSTGWESVKAAGSALSAIGELGSMVIHHWLVPNQKMAARVTLLKFELDRYAKKLGQQRGDYAGILSVMNPDVARQLASEVVDKVDFRLGQMTYDNFFIPKIARQVAQATFMAPGWLAGSIQTMTGGLRDSVRTLKPAKLVGPLDKAGTITDAHRGRFTSDQANLLMLFLMVGSAGALAQYLMSGKKPESLKDLVAPRTGRMNPDGSEERFTAPSYLKDHYEFFDEFPHGALAMVGHKLNPSLRVLWELAHNQDFFGAQIRNPHDGFGPQAEEVAGYLLKSMLPFTATNGRKVLANGDGLGALAANFVGVTEAPASITRSKFQAFVAKGGERGWDDHVTTPEEAAYRQKQRAAEDALRTGQTPDTSGLDPKDIRNLHKRVQTERPELQFDRLSLDDKLDAYDLATPAERAQYHLTAILRRTRPMSSIAFRRLPEAERIALMDRLHEVTRGR